MTSRRVSVHSHGASEIKSKPAVAAEALRQRKRLGGKLRVLRERAGFTQEEAAEEIGLHVKHLQRLESGRANVTLVTLIACALAYAVPLQALFETERAPREPFRRLPDDQARPFRNSIPLYTLRAAAGRFGSSQQVEPAAWVTPRGLRPQKSLFVARVTGESMNRRIPSGSFVVFRAPPRMPLQGKIVLAQHRSIADPDHGGQYTVKLLETKGSATRLLPLSTSRRYRPIVLRPADDLTVIAELVKVLR